MRYFGALMTFEAMPRITAAWHLSALFNQTAVVELASGIALSLSLFTVWALRRRLQAHKLKCSRDQHVREELQAYALLDPALGPGGDARPLARRVCRTIAERSAFRRVAMLVRDAEGKLVVSGSLGLDDIAVAALQDWGESAIRRERGLGAAGPVSAPIREKMGAKSFAVNLGPAPAASYGLHPPTAPAICRRAIVAMLRAQSGTVVGALAVCGDEGWNKELEEALIPLESLAVKLARTMENASLNERLARAERLAGLGRLAGGVAHELNNPLTAVLGFAELIAEVSTDARVREDARTIHAEALRMRETIQNLLHFWRPVPRQDVPVSLNEILPALAADCADKLATRGVELIIQCEPTTPAVRGDGDRLRSLFEHLLNNAAQAIASSNPGRRANDTPTATGLPRGFDHLDEAPAIRVTVTHDARSLQAIVSDTGPGFETPARVFDPFYTTREPGAGAGLGLSICYGIVREHGGEISAFNLHPHGAAVVVELPIRATVTEEEPSTPVLQAQGALAAWGGVGDGRRRG